MLEIPKEEVLNKLMGENPWWGAQRAIDPDFIALPRRSYLEGFHGLVDDFAVRRAVVLMGPRRVGKTVMIHHTIQRLIEGGADPARILYLSVDTPTFTGFGLEQLLNFFFEINEIERPEQCFVFFDEIQYLKDWEIHLKSLVDSYRHIKFVASGSAAAALKLKSRESGAGRFTDFLLPPLTFAEYLRFTEKERDLIEEKEEEGTLVFGAPDIEALNHEFINYLNYGGYPEAVMNERIQENPSRYVRGDIIDKVLLKDLPNLYGIQNIQELNKLLSTLAYNSGNEISLDALSQSSGVAKPTISRYLDYLETAFLIIRVERVDDKCKSFKRSNFFKVYLTNSSIRAALFRNITDSDQAMGNLAETAIYSQWYHWPGLDMIRYARWRDGEVDIIGLNRATFTPGWAYEIKWSDAYFHNPRKLKSLISFAKKNNLTGDQVGASTKTKEGITEVDGIKIKHFQCSLHCYKIGRNITEGRNP